MRLLQSNQAAAARLLCCTGVAHLRATLSGPSTGLYATYFNAGFSSDITLKFDILSLNETFNDLLATTVIPNTGT